MLKHGLVLRVQRVGDAIQFSLQQLELVRLDLVVELLQAKLMRSIALHQGADEMRTVAQDTIYFQMRFWRLGSDGSLPEGSAKNLLALQPLMRQAPTTHGPAVTPAEEPAPTPTPAPLYDYLDLVGERSEIMGDELYEEDIDLELVGDSHKSGGFDDIDVAYAPDGDDNGAPDDACDAVIVGDGVVAHVGAWLCLQMGQLRLMQERLQMNIQELLAGYAVSLGQGLAFPQAMADDNDLAVEQSGHMSMIRFKFDRSAMFLSWVTFGHTGRVVASGHGETLKWPTSSHVPRLGGLHDAADVIANDVGTRCLQAAGPKKGGARNNQPIIVGTVRSLVAFGEDIRSDGPVQPFHPERLICTCDQPILGHSCCPLCTTICHNQCMHALHQAHHEDVIASQSFAEAWGPLGDAVVSLLARFCARSSSLCKSCQQPV